MTTQTQILKINATELAELLVDADHGSTDWDIYVRPETGELSLRHNTYSTSGWTELIDLYNTTYDDVETYTVDDWLELIREWIRSGWAIVDENAGPEHEDVKYYIK